MAARGRCKHSETQPPRSGPLVRLISAAGSRATCRCLRRYNRSGRRWRLLARGTRAGRHLQLGDDLAGFGIDSPHIALVAFPCAVPKLAVTQVSAADLTREQFAP